MLLTKFLSLELTSEITEDIDESVGADCDALDTPPVERAGIAVAIMFRTGRTRIEPEPTLLPRSPCTPSPLLALLPTAETTGASPVPDDNDN